jgi:integrase
MIADPTLLRWETERPLVDLAEFAETFIEVMSNAELRPQFIAMMPDYLPLDRLNSLPVPEESPNLRDLVDLYVDQDHLRPEARMSVQWAYKTKLFWSDFCDTVKVDTVRELTYDIIRDYMTEVNGRKNENGKLYSRTYAKHRFGAVKSVLRAAAKRGVGIADCSRALECCRQLEKPGSGESDIDPNPISREQFKAMLDRTVSEKEPKWTAAFLLSLNCALYAKDLCRVLKQEIDLEKGTFKSIRKKTGIPRIAVLWPETIAAIRAYQAAEPHESSHLFVSHNGRPYTVNHVGRHFNWYRDKVGVPKTITFGSLRDAAQTAADEAEVDPLVTDRLMGHRTGGTRDNYSLRRPYMVRKACEAIRIAYIN